MNILEVVNLSHFFPDGSCGIENINLSIQKGEFIVIGGQNGSGKTTLCRHLNGLLRPSSGEVLLNGCPIQTDIRKTRQMVGMVFQNADTQIIGETVRSDIAFGPENLLLERAEINKRVDKAIHDVGLDNLRDHKPYTLSGGEKRKLAIAGVLAMVPSVIVFDEPFSNLDYPGSRQVLTQIIELHRTGHTIIIITHELEKVIAHADRLVIMQNGKIVNSGSPEQIIAGVEQYGIRTPCSVKLGKGVVSWLD